MKATFIFSLLLLSLNSCKKNIEVFYMQFLISKGPLKKIYYNKIYNCILSENILYEPIVIEKSVEDINMSIQNNQSNIINSKELIDTIGYTTFNYKNKLLNYYGVNKSKIINFDSTSVNFELKQGLSIGKEINELKYFDSQIKYDTFLNGYSLKYLDTNFYQDGKGMTNAKLFFSDEISIPNFNDYNSNKKYRKIGLVISLDSLNEVISFLPIRQKDNYNKARNLIKKINLLKP